MDRYQVVELNADGTLVGLRDQVGGMYIANLALPTLQMGDQIDGGPARAGMQIFMSIDGTRIHRLTMLHVGCPPLGLLDPEQPVAATQSALA